MKEKMNITYSRFLCRKASPARNFWPIEMGMVSFCSEKQWLGDVYATFKIVGLFLSYKRKI